MKGEKLFQIIGHIDDDLIGAAEDYKPAEKTINKIWVKWSAAVACVVIIISSGIWYLNNHGILPNGSGQGGGGHVDGSTFMHYAGPILPLNVSGDTTGITANRSTHFDFADYESEQKDLRVTDSYILANNTAKDKTIGVIYPFISSIKDSAKYMPAMTVNGKSLQTKLLMGDYTGGFTGVYGANGSNNTTHNLAYINSWEGYKALLESGKYFETAQGEKAFTDQTVTVYTFHDVTYPEEYDAATLEIEFDLPQGSRVITYGMNGASFDNENPHHRYDYFVSHAVGQKLIILGKPPADYKVQGYENGACEKKVDSIKGTVKTETMLLSKVIKDCTSEFLAQYGHPNSISPLVTEEHIFRAVVSMFKYTVLGDDPKDRYQWMRLDDLIGESNTMERVMYLSAQVTVPAGQSVEIESKFIKGASYDFTCVGRNENKGVTGYDMMTKLGSSLEFKEQKASISLPGTYEIIRQNFGFDLANGIDKVSLDMAKERYYLEIRKKGVADKH